MRSFPYRVSKPLADITWNLQRNRYIRWFTDSADNKLITDGVFISKISENILQNNPNIKNGTSLGRWEEYQQVINTNYLKGSPICLIATIEMEDSSYPYVLSSAMSMDDEIILMFFPEPYVSLLFNLNMCSRVIAAHISGSFSAYMVFIEDDKCVGILSPVIFNPMSNRFIAHHDHFKQLVADAYEISPSDMTINVDDHDYTPVLR